MSLVDRRVDTTGNALTRGHGDLLVGVVLGVVALGYFGLTVFDGIELRDEGHIYRQSARVMAGEVPHRDFADIYGPGVFWATGGLLALGGGQIAAVRIGLALLKALAVISTFWLTRQWTSRPFAAAAALFALAYWGQSLWLFNAPYASLYTLPLALLSLCLLQRGLGRDSPRWLAAAGVVAGLAVFFKQSVGVLTIYALVLVLLATAFVEAGRGYGEEGQTRAERPSRCDILAPGLLVLMGGAIFVPFGANLSLRDYALYMLPLHVWLGLVAWRVAAGRCGRRGLSIFFPRALAFGLGCGLPIAGVAALYAHWGALRPLVWNMFVFPLSVPNYASPARLPSIGAIAWLLALATAVTALLHALGGRWRRASMTSGAVVSIGAVALLLDPGGLQALAGSLRPMELHAPFHLAALVLPALAWAGLASFGPGLLADSERADAAGPALLLSLFLFAPLAQIFPTALYNVIFLPPLTAPLLGVVLQRWYRIASPPGRPLRAAAAAAVLLLPALVASPLVARTTGILVPDHGERALSLPNTRGISLGEAAYARQRIGDLEALIAYLRTAGPGDAPIFVLSNRAMITFLSGRHDLFADRAYHLSLAGWHLLPAAQLEGLDEGAMIARLERRPEALLISHPSGAEDSSPAELASALPELWSHIASHYAPERRFGEYVVLKRR